jgi:hypothetical protein
MTASIVSMAVPVKRCARRQIERHVETRRARIVGERQHFQLAGHARLDLQRAHLVIEFDQNAARLAEAVLTCQRLGDARGNLLPDNRAARARDDHFGKPAGIDADELVRPDRLDDPLRRHRAPGAEIGRAEDRHVGDRPGIIDEVADAHDVGGHGDAGAQRRHRILRGGGIGEKADQRQRQSEKSDDGADHQTDPSHFISCEVVCNISSAAVMTLEFIS